jgi:glucose dehydrogenase
MRFSALEELTPQNVRQLRPLFAVPASIDRESSPRGAGSPGKPVRAAPAQLGSVAGADAHLRDFVRWRATLIRVPPAAVPSPALDPVVNYIVESSGSLRAVAAAAPAQASGKLTARDPASGRVIWTARGSSRIGRGALLTAGGLVFYCSADGWFKALDARTGEPLWKQRLAGAKHGEPLSYEGGDGHQYVGVLSDMTGRTGTLQAFSLPR